MTAPSEWYEGEFVVASDSVLESRYGAIRIPVEQLRHFADEINERPLNMTADHDPTHLIRIKDVHAYVEQDADGEAWLLKLRARVHPDDWAAWERRRTAVGAPGGMSLSVTEPLLEAQEPADIYIHGDAADFEDDDLLWLASEAPDDATVEVGRLYQFAAEPEAARLVLGIVAAGLHAVPANLIAQWLAKVIGSLRERATMLGRRPAWDVRFYRHPNGAVKLDARYWLDDDGKAAEALRQVMETLQSLGMNESDEQDE